MTLWIYFGLILAIVSVTPKGLAQELPINSVLSAQQFRGATWAEQINAAVAGLPTNGGTIDARELCVRRQLVSADTDVVLGSDRQLVRLILGACIYPLGTHGFLYFPNTEIGGMGMNVPGNTGTTISFQGSGAALAYGGSLQGTGVYNVFLHDFSVIGDGTPGSVGLDMTYALSSTLERISTNGSDNGWRFGKSPTCACYNQIIKVIAFDRSRGGWLSKTANQNQVFGGAVRANRNGGIGLDIAGAGSNQIYSLDIENSTKYSIALERNGWTASANAIVNPYIEAAGPILIGSGSEYNSIVGSGGLFERGSVVDESGNATNYIHQTGGGGGTDGMWPYYEVVEDGLYFGVSPDNALKILSNGAGPRSPMELRWNGGLIAPQFGLAGHAPLEFGEAILHSGADIAGLVTTTMIQNYSPPVVTPKGNLGNTPYSYYLVCHDRNGGVTDPSPAGSTSTGDSTLDAANYNQISWQPIDGCWSWDLLKGNRSTALATFLQPELSGFKNSTFSFIDRGQRTFRYTPVNRNTSGDLRLAGMMVSIGLRWPLPEPVVNGGSFYCPNCDPPKNPPQNCTSGGARSGSWVHGLEDRWICIP